VSLGRSVQEMVFQGHTDLIADGQHQPQLAGIERPQVAAAHDERAVRPLSDSEADDQQSSESFRAQRLQQILEKRIAPPGSAHVRPAQIGENHQIPPAVSAGRQISPESSG